MSGALKFGDFVGVADAETWVSLVSGPSEQAGRVKRIPAIRIYIKICFLLNFIKTSCYPDGYVTASAS